MKKMAGENHYLTCQSEDCDFAPCVGRREFESKIKVLIYAINDMREGLEFYSKNDNDLWAPNIKEIDSENNYQPFGNKAIEILSRHKDVK